VLGDSKNTKLTKIKASLTFSNFLLTELRWTSHGC